MTTETTIYIVAREGYAEQFSSRICAKVAYEQLKQEFPETTLRKERIKKQVLQYDEKSGCWL